MNQTQNHILDVYEEDSSLTVEISAILSAHSSAYKKERKLEELQNSVTSPLAQSHIAYYVNKIRARRRALCARIIAMPFIVDYLFYILYRTYFYIYPEKPHYDLAPGLTAAQRTLAACLLPVFVLVCYMVYNLLSERSRG